MTGTLRTRTDTATPDTRCACGIGAAGAAGAVLAVIAGRGAYTGTTHPPTAWFGLLAHSGYLPGDDPLWGLLLFAGLATLVGSWLAALRLRARLSEHHVWWIGIAWALPLAIGPPLASKDGYAYVAHGALQHFGLDPYRVGPERLAGHGQSAERILASVDPRWRGLGSPYGPLATMIERLAYLIGGNALGALLVLRLVALAALAVVAVIGVRLVHVPRAGTLLAVALNPLVLVHGLSGMHLDIVMCALLFAGLLAARRGRWEWAVALTCLAGMVKAPALLAVAILVAVHVGRTRRLRNVFGDLAVAGVAVAIPTLLIPDGFGWIANMSTPGHGSPAMSVTGALGAAATALGAPGLASALTVIGALGAVAIAGYLTWTHGERPLPHTVGWALLAIAFLAPVTYPWYLLWGVPAALLAARGLRRDVLVALSAVAVLLDVPALASPTGGVLSACAIVVAVIAVLYRHRCYSRTTEPITTVRSTGRWK